MSAELADLARRLRAAHGWTQAELGERLGIGRTQVTMIESGRNDTPAGPLLRLLAEVGWAPVPDETDRAWGELCTAAARWDAARARYAALAKGKPRSGPPAADGGAPTAH